jgi:hypothetical protein
LLARLVGLQSAQTMASETVAGRRACDGRSKGAQRPLVLRSAAATVGDLCRTTSGHSSTSRFRLLGVTGVKAAVGGVAWAAGPRPGGARRAADRADRGEALIITDGQGCRANGRAIKIGGFSGAGGQLRGSEGGKGSALASREDGRRQGERRLLSRGRRPDGGGGQVTPVRALGESNLGFQPPPAAFPLLLRRVLAGLL